MNEITAFHLTIKGEVADMGKDPFKEYLHQKNTQNVWKSI